MKKQILAAVLSTLTLALWADEQKIIFSFDGETGNKPSQFVKERRWKIGGDDAAGTIEIVRANDHANGGKALKLTKKNGLYCNNIGWDILYFIFVCAKNIFSGFRQSNV